MKLSLAIAAGVAVLGAAHAASAANVFEVYNYTYSTANFDTANIGVTNTNSFAYTDVTIAGFDLGALAAGASTSVNIGDPGEGGPYSGVISITSAQGNGSGTFTFPDYDYSSTHSLGSISIGTPEPATWALMLVGFGGLGVALRSRRRATLTA